MKKTIKIIEPWSGKKHDVNIITLLFYVVITTILIIYFRLSWERGNFNFLVFISIVIVYFFTARYFLFNKKLFRDFNLNNEAQMLTKEDIIFLIGYFISFGGLYFGDDYPFVMIILFIVGILITTIGLKLQIKKKPINKFVLKNRTIMKILWIMQILLFGFFIFILFLDRLK